MKPTILIATAALLLPTLAKADTATFLPTGAGLWDDAANWSGGIIPNNGSPTAGTVWDVTIPAPALPGSGELLSTLTVSVPIAVHDLQMNGLNVTSDYLRTATRSLQLTSELTITGAILPPTAGPDAMRTLRIEGPGKLILTGATVWDTTLNSSSIRIGTSIENHGTLTLTGATVLDTTLNSSSIRIETSIENHGTLTTNGTVFGTDRSLASYHGFTGSIFNPSYGEIGMEMSSFTLDSGAALNTSEVGFVMYVVGAVALHGSINAVPYSALAINGNGAVTLSGNWVVNEGALIDNQGYGGQTISAPLTVSGGKGSGNYQPYTGLKLGGDTMIAPGASLTVGVETQWYIDGGDGSLSGGDAHVFGMFSTDGERYSVKDGGRLLIENGGTLNTTVLYDPVNSPFSVDDGGEVRIKVGGTVRGPVVVNGTGIFVIEGAIAVPEGASIAMTGGGTSSGTITVPVGSSLSLGNFTLAAGAVLDNSGTVSFNGAVMSVSPLTVTGTIGGSGSLTISELTISTGVLAPGNSPGTLTINGDLTLGIGSTSLFELGTASDLTLITGDFTLDGLLNVVNSGGFGAGTYTLFDYAGTLTDNGLALGSAPSGYNYSVVVDNAQTQVKLVVAPVPEPGSAVFLLLGLAALAGRRRVGA